MSDQVVAYEVPNKVFKNLPTLVKDEVLKLSPTKQEQFVEEYKRRAKSENTGHILWFFLGWHYIYLRKWGLQFLYWFTLGGFLIWVIVDFFRVPGMVRDYNKDVALSVLKDIKAVSS